MEAEHDVEQRQVAAAQVEVLLVPWLGAPCRGAGHAGPEDAVLSVEQDPAAACGRRGGRRVHRY
jgi:hypothetical protein